MRNKRTFQPRAALAVGILSLHYLAPQQALAACVLTPGPGNDTYTCDSGSSINGY